MAIFDLDPKFIDEIQVGTLDNIDKSKAEFNLLAQKILALLKEY